MVVVDLDGEGDMAVLIVCRYRTLSLSTYYIDPSKESGLHSTIGLNTMPQLHDLYLVLTTRLAEANV